MLSTSPNILQTFNCSGFASTSNETHRSDLKQASRHSMTVCTFLDKTVGICSGMRLLLNILFLISLDSRLNPFLKVTLQSWTEIERWYIARKITAKNILPIMMFFWSAITGGWPSKIRVYIFSCLRGNKLHDVLTSLLNTSHSDYVNGINFYTKKSLCHTTCLTYHLKRTTKY